MTASALGHLLSTLRDGVTGFAGDQSRPMPLSAMRIEVVIEAGLAVVATTRTFRNAESEPVEAVLTFPVAFDAVVTGLVAQVDGRMLRATSQAKVAARDAYEGAVARGKLAILHEEVLKGVHVLSVGQLGPGAEVAVTVETVMPLAALGGALLLRVPTTVGDLYGTSPLIPADDLVTGPGALAAATLRVTADAARVSLDGHGPLVGDATVPLDRPVVLRCEGGALGERFGRDAFGRTVRLALQPVPWSDAPLDCAVLFDRSGSTRGAAGAGGGTVWEAMRGGLVDAAASLSPADTLALWQFDSHCEHLGTAKGAAAAAQLAGLVGPPAGGTELGKAVDRLAAVGVRDIVMMTDGQTHASEVQTASAAGCRVSAILVGDGSLDAGVGHLAAMTGGSVAWAPGAEVGAVLRLALEGMRTPGAATTGLLVAGRPASLDARRAGVALSVAWEGPGPAEGAGDPALADPVGRYAAALALPLLDETAAGTFAAAHGLCTHLTSLVLVDEAGQAQEGLPAMRKVPLAAARVLYAPSLATPAPHAVAPASMPRVLPRVCYSMPPPPCSPAPRRALPTGVTIDWAADGARLAAGDLTILPEDTMRRIEALAADPDILALAQALGVDPCLAVVGLLAEEDGRSDRHAKRVAQRLLHGATNPVRMKAKLALFGSW